MKALVKLSEVTSPLQGLHERASNKALRDTMLCARRPRTRALLSYLSASRHWYTSTPIRSSHSFSSIFIFSIQFLSDVVWCFSVENDPHQRFRWLGRVRWNYFTIQACCIAILERMHVAPSGFVDFVSSPQQWWQSVTASIVSIFSIHWHRQWLRYILLKVQTSSQMHDDILYFYKLFLVDIIAVSFSWPFSVTIVEMALRNNLMPLPPFGKGDSKSTYRSNYQSVHSILSRPYQCN